MRNQLELNLLLTWRQTPPQIPFWATAEAERFMFLFVANKLLEFEAFHNLLFVIIKRHQFQWGGLHDMRMSQKSA